MGTESAVGRDGYVFFLRDVALVPFSPEELLAMGRQEWERSVAFEAYEKNRNQGAARDGRSSPTRPRRSRAEAKDEARGAALPRREGPADRARHDAPLRLPAGARVPARTSRASASGPSSPRPPA